MNEFKRDNLYRASFPALQTRGAFGEETPPTLTGHFAVFNEPTEINSMWEGNFMERIAPGAFRKTFKDNRDSIRVLFQHGRDPQVGDKPLGTIESLSEDQTGAYYEVPLIDTSYNRDLLPGLQAGLYGASFRFKVMREDITEEPGASAGNPKGLPERLIREAQVMEFGPVTFPAYAGATAGVRSITDELRDVDALAYAGAVMLDDERFNRARIFVTRGLPTDEATPIPTEADEVSRLRERKDALTRAMDDAEPAAQLDGDTVEALGSLIEVCESALEAMESLLGIDDDVTPDADEMNSAEAEGTIRNDAPPVDDAEHRSPRPWTPREDNPPPRWWRSRDDEEVPSAWR